MKQLYEQKGYPKEWIDKRLRGIAVRQDLTDEWQQRGAKNSLESSRYNFYYLDHPLVISTEGRNLNASRLSLLCLPSYKLEQQSHVCWSHQ
jgi:hypothetical protein